MAAVRIPAPPGADLSTPGDYLRQTGQELLAAHRHLQAARELLLEWRVRAPDGGDWARPLPRQGGES
jgi:hypothetical protein